MSHHFSLICFASSWVFSAIHWGGSMSFQVSHISSLGWLHVVPDVLLSLTGVALHCPMCFTDTHCGGFVLFQVFHGQSFGSIFVIQGDPLLLSGLTLYHFRCPSAAHCGGFRWFIHLANPIWSKLSHCCLLGCFFLLSQVSNCHSLGWLPVVQVFHSCSLRYLCVITGF